MVEIVKHRGWHIYRLSSDVLQVDVVPGKGGDLLSVRWLPTDLELLWQSPWGLRHRGAMPTGAETSLAVYEAYPGGWQTMFPNIGAAAVEQGVLWPAHGEVWVTPFDVEGTGLAEIRMTTRLVRSPFTVKKTVRVDAGRIDVIESITNQSRSTVEVAWGHHPAFGGPLVSHGCHLDIEGGALLVDTDDSPPRDLLPSGQGRWPMAPGKDGNPIDLRVVPTEDSGINRLVYVGELQQGRATLTNADLGLQASLSWDCDLMPYATVFTECHASAGFPWFEDVHLLAVEPCTSAPCHGLKAIREQTGTQVAVQAGESRTTTITLEVRALERTSMLPLR